MILLRPDHDWSRSPLWQDYVDKSCSDRIVLGLFYDGVPAFRGLKWGTHTTHVVTLEILNLPFHLRADPRFVIVSDLIPGPRKPKNIKPWFIPLLRDLKSKKFNVLFASADYPAHVELLRHSFLGYHGCSKCEKTSLAVGDFFDWASLRHEDPARAKTGEIAVQYGEQAEATGEKKNGFYGKPILAEIMQDCIRQHPEDALHLIEGCLKKHLFQWLAGKKHVKNPGDDEDWKGWMEQLSTLSMNKLCRDVLDQRWKDFCSRTGMQ